jgi:hypothetical protein
MDNTSVKLETTKKELSRAEQRKTKHGIKMAESDEDD